MKKEDFVKFFYENKDKQGFVHINKIAEHFRFNNSDDGVGIERIPTFLSSHGKYFLKFVFMSNELDAEILMPRVYEKLGFKEADRLYEYLSADIGLQTCPAGEAQL